MEVAPQPATGEGPLDGIPFGAKDIIETAGLATEYGSAIYKGRRGSRDAAIVRLLRERGAILLGKTQTTAFAWRTPAPTRNPRHLAHTPGGSSSGSAAAVAAGVIPIALGTQTLGSVLRPASYCGITGFKPGYGVLPLDGVLPCAPSLDTVGLFTHTPADMLALWDALGQPVGAARDVAFGVVTSLRGVDQEMTDAVDRAMTAARRAGLTVVPVDLADLLADLAAAGRVVLAYEAAQVHRQRFEEHGDALADMADLVREGQAIPADRHAAALDEIRRSAERVQGAFRDTPIIVVPAATGPAPRGLASTGDPAMNAPWTALGVPAISIPMPVGSALPLGLQLTAARGDEATLLRAAVRMERALAPS